jgi:predicted ATPase
MRGALQAILAARIDRLTPEAKRLLQAAAVIGKDVPMPLLLAIADAPEHEVRAELTRLQAAEFLYETASPVTSRRQGAGRTPKGTTATL